MDPPPEQQERLRVLYKQSLIAGDEGARLIVMPELGLGFDPQIEYTDEFKRLSEETGAHLLIGYGLDDPSGWRNEMVMLTPDGNFLDTYGKNHPTSPGEPPIISSGRYPVYDIKEGRIATLICNDIHYTDVSRTLARKGAQLIAAPTLEGPGIALEQVAQAVMRAVENRVAIVKADVAYASAIIDPYGKIIALRNGSPDGEAFSLVAEVPLGTTSTIYSRIGDLPGWICLAGYIFFLVFQAVVTRRLRKS
jgi:apolipoprotein N-acyltransferase